MTAIARLEGVTYSYPGAERPALRDVTLAVDPAEVILLLGGSGSGKSTLLRALNGLVPHFHGGTFAGRVTVDEYDTRTARTHELARRVGLVFQDPENQAVMTTVEREIAFHPLRDAALAFTAGIPLIPITDEALALAQMLIEQRVMPGPLKGDAVHVAAAAFHGIDYLLTWNVKHLANPNKRIHLAQILMLAGKGVPTIVTPDVLWED